MRVGRFLPALIVAFCVAMPANGDSGPPLIDGWFVDDGACPFEGCTYRDWTTEKDTVLYDTPFGNQMVARARAGEPVEGVTGIVYVRPVPIRAAERAELELQLYDERVGGYVPAPLLPGETVYLLTYQGEGAYKAWTKGRIYHGFEFYPDMMDYRSEDGLRITSCETPTPTCWWQVAPEYQQYESDWWVQIRLPDGAVGWTNKPGNFSNIDLFG